MKALVKSQPTRGLWLEDVPMPVIGPHDVLIKVKKASLCGTDLNIYKWGDWASKNVPIGLTIGHEFMGEIVEIGPEVKKYHSGQRVSAEGHLTCGECLLCRSNKRHLCPETRGIGYHAPGAFAEYIAVPEENVFLLPDNIPGDVACFFDAFGNAVHTAFSSPLKDQDVLITGAGPIGIMATAIAKHAGARNIVITDINEYRLNLAKKMGATHAVNVDETALSEVVSDMTLTVGMEMSGSPNALSDLLNYCINGANISLLGVLPPNTIIDWDLVIFKMLTLKGIYGREIFKTWHQMTDLVTSGLDLNPMITHSYKLEEFEKGFSAMFSGDCGKVILEI